MSPDARIVDLASRQHGLLTTVQLHRLGCSEAMVRSRVRRGILDRMSRLVVRVGGSPTSAEQEVLAAVWSSGATATASHATAAWLWGIDGVERPAPPHVTVLRPAGGCRPLATIHQTGALADVDRAVVKGIPVTSVGRTLVDLGATEPVRVVESALDGALRDGLVTRAFLRWRLDELHRPGPGGAGRLRTLLDGAEGPVPGAGSHERHSASSPPATCPHPGCSESRRAAASPPGSTSTTTTGGWWSRCQVTARTPPVASASTTWPAATSSP